MGPELGAAAGLGRWLIVGGAVLRFTSLVRFPEEEAALNNHSAQSPARLREASPGHFIGHCKNDGVILLCVGIMVEPALGALAGLGRWFVGVAVLPVWGNFQRRRR